VTRSAADELPLAPEGADRVSSLDEVRAALERGDHATVLLLTERILAARPGDDAAHEFRARSLLALDRLDEAERHAADAVRLDPEEIRYRELWAQILSRRGSHRDAAAEYGRLARNDPGEATWTLAEARERIDASQARLGAEAARRAVQLEPDNGQAQLALAKALTRTGDASGAYRAAVRATELLPGDVVAREALADALWLADDGAAAFAEFRALAAELTGRPRARTAAKARRIYRQQAGWPGRAVAAIGPLFRLALDRGWVHVAR
jgi:Flp pilus assembly protein TadD